MTSLLLLVVVVLWIGYRAVKGRRDYNELKTKIGAGETAALDGYLERGIVRKASIACLTALLLVFQGGDLPLQFAHASLETTLLSCVFITLAIVGSIFLFRRWGNRQLRFLMKTAGAILPKTGPQRRRFLVLSLLAGIEEELFFRWLITSLALAVPGMTLGPALVVSSALFGLAHLYQGWLGIVATALLGGVFSHLWLTSGSLIVPIVTHALIDARIPFILTPERVRSLENASTT